MLNGNSMHYSKGFLYKCLNSSPLCPIAQPSPAQSVKLSPVLSWTARLPALYAIITLTLFYSFLQETWEAEQASEREGDSIIELRVWLCTEKLLLHVSPRGLSILLCSRAVGLPFFTWFAVRQASNWIWLKCFSKEMSSLNKFQLKLISR